MLLNCAVGEDSWESLGLQGDPTSPFWRRSTLGFLGRNDAKAETPVLWPPHVKSWLIRKNSDAGRDWGQEEKGTTEDEMAGWHHQLDGHEFGWTLGVGDGQGGLACCNSWITESDTTEWLDWTESCYSYIYQSFIITAFWVSLQIATNLSKLCFLFSLGIQLGYISQLVLLNGAGWLSSTMKFE